MSDPAPTTTVDADLLAAWKLTPVRELTGGSHNQHWLVRTAGGAERVLRRYRAGAFADLDYEVAVMDRLRRRGWPTPEVVEPLRVHGGRTWCLMTRMPGLAAVERTPAEQRRRGRLLAELHADLRELTDLGQRQGWELPDVRVHDPDLLSAVRRYESVRPVEGYLLRWHLERAAERLAALPVADADALVLHSDLLPANVLYEGDVLTGVIDFEATHLSFRVSDFALSWRGHYDDILRGYEEVQPLTDLDWQLLVPAFWSWLFIGLRDELTGASRERLRRSDYAWHVKQLRRRSPLFGDLRAPCPEPAAG